MVATIRKTAPGMRTCLEPLLPPADRASVEATVRNALAWVDEWDPKLQTEAACRKSDSCLGNGVCLAIADKADAQKEMKRERANPSGVVDLVRLHDLGERMQADDEEIARRKGWYQQWRSKVFQAGLHRAPGHHGSSLAAGETPGDATLSPDARRHELRRSPEVDAVVELLRF